MLFQFFMLTSTVALHFPNELFNLLFSESPRTMVLSTTIFSFLRMLSLLQFGRVYIVTKKKFPRLHRTLGISLGVLLILTILGITFRVYSFEIGNLWFQIRQIPMGIIMTAILLCLIYLVQSKDKLARVYSFGILLPFAAILFRLIQMNLSNSPAVSYTHLPSPRDATLSRMPSSA